YSVAQEAARCPRTSVPPLVLRCFRGWLEVCRHAFSFQRLYVCSVRQGLLPGAPCTPQFDLLQEEECHQADTHDDSTQDEDVMDTLHQTYLVVCQIIWLIRILAD